MQATVERLKKRAEKQAEYVRKNLAGKKIKPSGDMGKPYRSSIDIIREKRAIAKAKAAQNNEEKQ